MKKLLLKIASLWWAPALIVPVFMFVSIFQGISDDRNEIIKRNTERKQQADDEAKAKLKECVEKTNDVNTCHFWIYDEHLYKQDEK